MESKEIPLGGDCQTSHMSKAGVIKMGESQSPVTSGPGCLTPFFPPQQLLTFCDALGTARAASTA